MLRHVQGVSCDPVCIDPPVVDNAVSLEGCANVPSGGNCTLTCADGYVPSVPVVVCEAGVWPQATFGGEPLGWASTSRRRMRRISTTALAARGT